MYKTKLQEFCQGRSWSLPKYASCREGPDHNPRFRASVTVENQSFQSRDYCKSSKEAQNDAAYVAFLYFSGTSNVASEASKYSNKQNIEPKIIGAHCTTHFSSSFPPAVDDSGSKGPCNATFMLNNFSSNQKFARKEIEADQIYHFGGSDSCITSESGSKGVHHLYKNQLQTYVQKQNLHLPTYSCEREGPPHACQFRCKVTVGEVTFESQEFFPTVKEAEHAVAKIALSSLLPNATREVDYIVYKNLLQELAQKEGYFLPVYRTMKFGEAHSPTFLSTVEVAGKVFKGNEAKTKKQAEMSAANVAYLSLTDGNPVQDAASLPPSSPRHEVVDHSLYASSNSCVIQQQESGSKPPNSLSPNLTPKQHVKGTEASRALKQSQHADGNKNYNPVLSFPAPNNSSSSMVKETNISSSMVTATNASSSGQNLVKTVDSPIDMPTHGNMVSRSRKRVWVLPHEPNMEIPPGCEVFLSDDKWVALKVKAQPNP